MRRGLGFRVLTVFGVGYQAFRVLEFRLLKCLLLVLGASYIVLDWKAHWFRRWPLFLGGRKVQGQMHQALCTHARTHITFVCADLYG